MIGMSSFWKIIMSINVNNQTTQKSIIIEQNKAQKQQNISKSSIDSSAKNQDSVQITSQAQSLNKMQSAGEPEVNTQRVEALKAAIINGDYKINSERLADKMSKFEGDFGKAFG